MKALLLIVSWLMASVVAAAWLTPWVYLGIQALAENFPWLQGLADYKFHRYFNRMVMVFALLGLVGVGRTLGYRSCSALGLGGPHRAGRFGLGFAASAVFIGSFAAVVCLLGFTEIGARINGTLVARAILAAAATALVVALVEELFFRGFLYDSIRRETTPTVAIVLVSLFYSAVHFIKSPGDYQVQIVRWDSAFEMLPHYFSAVQDPERLMLGFVNLFIVGWILAWAYQSTGNLYLSIGLHAGWVFSLKLNGKLTEWTPFYTRDTGWLLGFGGDVTTSTIALVVLFLQWWTIQGLSKRLIVLGP